MKVVEESGQATVATIKATKELRKRLRIAEVLDGALDELRAIEKTNDYFTGYSLNEALTERINLIGNSGSPDSYIGGRLTLIAQLLALKETTLAAIKEAKTINELTPVGEKADSLQVELHPES